ncbi:MAG TPA: hypothetical protein EYH05_15880, partial [Anaerolineae bacterium]|nr:hypothetical protein [Anaerolineae bacterium]
NPDSPQKRQELADWLDEADYVVLSSQRALWSLPRIPLTYPMMIRYYEALFSGELGFDLVYQNQADYQIGPLRISDVGGKVRWGAQPEVGWPPPGALAAEEAFSVYDHPPVWIFAKTDAYSRENTLNILDDVDLSQTAFMTPGDATRAPNGLMMSAETAALQQAGGTFRELFNVNGILSNNWMLAAVVWWLALMLLGWLAFPLAFLIFRGLPDKGYALSRMLAIFLVAYFVWITGSLSVLPNTAVTAGLGVLLLSITSIVITAKNREDLAGWRQANKRYILFVELFALGLFVLAILIRLGNPDLWDVIWGGEKPMDLTYFTAVLKSTVFPPYDPWFAGGYLNYYYYGFVLAGVLPKLLGVVPALAYNLNLVTFYALTGLGVFGVAYNIVAKREIGDWRLEIKDRTLISNLQSPISKKALTAGVIAAILAVFLGNLAEVGVLINAWTQAGNPEMGGILRMLDGGVKVLSGQPAPIYPGDWFWTATRAINAAPGEAGPITEFPFFTFLYGDLHAHMLSLPVQMLALAWAVSAVFAANLPACSQTRTFIRLGIGGLIIGSLQAINIWDYPTYLVIGM